MKIKTITSRYRNDFTAIMECEHCGRTQRNDMGYDDENYHCRVIPEMFCRHCGKRRDGASRKQHEIGREPAVPAVWLLFKRQTSDRYCAECGTLLRTMERRLCGSCAGQRFEADNDPDPTGGSGDCDFGAALGDTQ